MSTGAQDGATAIVAPSDTHALHAYPGLVAQSGGGLVQYPHSGRPRRYEFHLTAAGARPNQCRRRCLQCDGAFVRMDHTSGLRQTSPSFNDGNECNQVLVYCLTNGFTTPSLRHVKPQ